MKRWIVALLLFAAPVAAQDAIPRDQLFPVGPGLVSSDFPIATTITRVTFNPNGMEVDFTKKDGPGRWPDGRTPGWNGDLQYSVGWVVRVNDWWYASAPIENWHGRTGGTGPLQDQTVTNAMNPQCMGQFQCNIFYDQRWDPLQTRRPSPGETIGVYVVSGDARNDAFYGVRERSNIVLVQLPGPGQTAAFDFTGANPPPPPVPVPPPAPPPAPTPQPVPQPVPQVPPVAQPPPVVSSIDFDAAIRRVLNEELLPLERDTHKQMTDLSRSWGETVGRVLAFVGKYGGMIAAGVIPTWLMMRDSNPTTTAGATK